MTSAARAIREEIAGSGVKLIVNDRVDVALAAGADGVHLGQEDMEPSDARHLLGPDAIIGISIKLPHEAEEAPVYLVDYAFVGGVFDTRSKNNPDSVGIAGWSRLAGILRRRSPGLPVGAIAGIDETNAASLFEAGADGIAVISALFMRENVSEAARRLAGIAGVGRAA